MAERVMKITIYFANMQISRNMFSLCPGSVNICSQKWQINVSDLELIMETGIQHVPRHSMY